VSDRLTITGLSETEARQRLTEGGPNVITGRARPPTLTVALDALREPMFIMLVAGGGLYLAMGKLSDGLLLLSFVLVVIGSTILQRRRTEKALDALRQMSSPRCLVIRDGKEIRLSATELVCGDIIALGEGDRVPADALLRQSTHLAIDESLLTGESVPVSKAPSIGTVELGEPGGDHASSLYGGTLVTSGGGLAEIVATGARTRVARIGAALSHIDSDRTPLQKETDRLVRWLATAGIVACIGATVVFALTRGGDLAAWREGGLAGIAMAMSLIPEEFPVVLSVFLAVGAWHMSKRNVLTRHIPAIEGLSAMNVLCVDKTGTLTRNQLQLVHLADMSREVDLAAVDHLDSRFTTLLTTALAATKPQSQDPLDKAIRHAAERLMGVTTSEQHALLHEYPLMAARPAMGYVRHDGENRVRLASKGAPEVVARLCNFTDPQQVALHAVVSRLAEQGLRVIGVAQASGSADRRYVDLQTDFSRLEFLGLLAFADPLRADVPQAVADCREAGIRVVMITGDYPKTALAIARQAGIVAPDHPSVLTGAEMDALDEATLAERVQQHCIFARVRPEQKLRLVKALQARGHVVAMTGDGVNDAPALKAADIGIAMGQRGSEVAREASDLVLLDDAFPSIVAAIRQGRKIYDNIKKASVFIIAVHVPIAGLALLPLLDSAAPLILLPIHIVIIEMIIDPTCALVFEAEQPDRDLMQRPARSLEQSLFSSREVILALLQGLSVLLACTVVYEISNTTDGYEVARTSVFCTLISSLIALIYFNRSWSASLREVLSRHNPALYAVTAFAVICLLLALSVPMIRDRFSFVVISLDQVLWSSLLGVASLLWFEATKRQLLTRSRKS
jgi:Ca2+-transporting ATPase